MRTFAKRLPAIAAFMVVLLAGACGQSSTPPDAGHAAPFLGSGPGPGGSVSVRHDTTLTGNGSPASPLGTTGVAPATTTVQQLDGTVQTTTVIGVQDDFALNATATILRINGASSSQFDGLTGGVDGRILFIENLGTSQVTLSTENAGSTAANRILGFNNQSVTISTNATNPNAGATLIYDGPTARWRVISVGTTAVNTSTTFTGGLSTLSTATFSSILTVNNNLRFNSVQSPTALSGSTNDYNPTNLSITNTLRQDVSAAATLTGLTAQGTGTIITITNIATTPGFTLTFTNEDAASTAANRFTLINGASLVLNPGGSVTFRYDGVSSRWRPITQHNGTQLVAITPTAIAGGTTNDYNPTGLSGAQIIYQDCNTGTCGFTGIAGGVDGRMLDFCNISSTNTINIQHQNASSAAANRIITVGALTTNISGGTSSSCVNLVYDGAVSRWRMRSASRFPSLIIDGAATISGNLTSNATTTLAQLKGTVQTDTTTGTIDNFVLTATTTILRVAPASSAAFDGFKCGAADCASGDDGRMLIVENAGAGTVTLVNESAGSVAGNRILATDNGTATLAGNASNPNNDAILVYDGTSLRWRIAAINTRTFSTSVSLTGTSVFISGATTHISVVGGTAPGLTSCGTGSPTITGSDIAGRVVEGTTATGCIITFGTTYTTVPSCVVTSETQLAAFSYVVSATAITLTNTSNTGDVVHYHCMKAS